MKTAFFTVLLLVCCFSAASLRADGVEVECDKGVATVTVTVNACCPDSTGVAEATVYDYTTTPPAGEQAITRHMIKSKSPCGCVSRYDVPTCIPNGSYKGHCEKHLCTYKIPCNCKH